MSREQESIKGETEENVEDFEITEKTILLNKRYYVKQKLKGLGVYKLEIALIAVGTLLLILSIIVK